MVKEMRKTQLVSSVVMHADGADMWLMALGLIGAVCDGISTPVVFYVGSQFMNNIGLASSSDSTAIMYSINKNAMALVYVAIGSWISCFLEGFCWTRTGERQTSRMRARYLKAVLRQDVGFFDLHFTSTSEVIASVSKDSLVIQDVLSEKVPNFLTNMSLFIGSYIWAFIMIWRLALVGLPFVVLLVIPGLIYGRTLMGLARKMSQEYTQAGTIAEQAISSIRTVYAFVGENKTVAEYSKALQGSVKLGLRQGLAKGWAIGSNGIVFAICAFMCYYGSRMVMYHGAQGGTVYNVGAAIAIGGLSFGAGISNFKYFSEACSAAERIMELIESVPEIDSYNEQGQVLHNVDGEVEFRHVEFAYPSRPESIILKDFCLKVSAGTTVALVGGSGSGKSTVMSLMQRFYNPIGGEIVLDGVAIDKLQLKWLRSLMGLVNQEPALFATSIKENILFGKEDAEIEEIVEAAKAANAHNFICQLPLGYDTQVGERGIQVSGGQKQRIAIARAIIKKPKILLLDEATSAMDSGSEQIVQQALDNVVIGRTTIIVAHRLSTVRNADLIAVLQNGYIVESGLHEELIQHDESIYNSLFRLQQTTKDEKSTQEVAMTLPSYNSSSIFNIDGNSTSSHRLSAVSPSISTNLAAVGVEETKFPQPSFGRLLALNSPEWKQASIGCLSAFLVGAVQPFYAFAMGSMVSVYFLTNHDQIKEKTRIYVLSFVGLAIFSLLINVIQHYNFAYMGEYLTKRIREKMLSKILTFEVAWFDQAENSTGAICSRLDKDANVVRSLVGDRISIIVQAFSAVTIACIMGLIIAWKLAIVMIAIQPLVILCFYTQKVLLKSMTQKSIAAQDESSKLAAEAVSNIRTIASFSSQDRILKLFEKAQFFPREKCVQQSWFAGVVLATSRALITLTWSLDYWYGGKLISQGQITAKELFETFMILLSTGRVVAEAGSTTTDLVKGYAAVSSVFAVLDRSPRFDPDGPQGHKVEKLTGNVEICNIDFCYPSRPGVMIFRDFSLKVEAGKSTALVGRSGSGKSTIIHLMERFYDPIKGVIKIDGLDLRSYNLRSLRKHIALVSQEPPLFSGTIRENIMYGADDGIDEVEIIEVSKAANAHDFISGLTDGYDTWCGDKGVQLSGGQKQRIAIARAVLNHPVLLLCDEATSALDGSSETVVQEALDRLMVGRTSVVVAHRLSTVENCDEIVVLDNGKVVEEGTHKSLVSKGPAGFYYSLVGLEMPSIQTGN